MIGDIIIYANMRSSILAAVGAVFVFALFAWPATVLTASDAMQAPPAQLQAAWHHGILRRSNVDSLLKARQTSPAAWSRGESAAENHHGIGAMAMMPKHDR